MQFFPFQTLTAKDTILHDPVTPSSEYAFRSPASRMQSDDSPAAIPDHTLLLLLQESKVDAIQRHTTGLYLDRLPSSSTTTKKDVVVLSHSRVDSAPEVFLESSEAHAEASFSKDMACAVLDLKRRLDEQQARDRNSMASLQSELAKLTSMAAQLAVFIGKQTTSAVPGSSPLEVGGTASVAPRVFDKMPTPSSEHENCSVHPNQGSCVHGGRTILSEQNLNERSHRYDFSNLSRRTLSHADGTEQSYYALPENYPLQRAVPELVCAVGNDKTEVDSNESVDVFASNPEKQPYEEDSACPSITTDLQDLPLEPQQQDDERACNGPSLKASDSSTRTSSQFSFVQSSRELRLLWDPGASAILVTPLNNDNNDTTIGVFNESVLDIPPAKPPERYGSAESSPVYVQEKRKEWDPGDIQCHDLLMTAADATKLQCTNAYTSTMVQILVVQFGAGRAPILKSATMRSSAFGLKWTEVNALFLFVLVVQCSAGMWVDYPFLFLSDDVNSRTNHYFPKLFMYSLCTTTEGQVTIQRQMLNVLSSWFPSFEMDKLSWDPGILNTMYMLLDKYTVPNLMDMKHFWTLLLLQYHSWCTIPNAFLQDQYCCLPTVLDCLYSELVKQLVCYTSIFSSNAWCISIAATVRMQLVWCSGEIAQEGRDAAALYQVSKIQLPMRKISHVWDPGIESILAFYKGKHIQIIQLVHCSDIHAYNFIAAPLSPTTLAAYCPSNLGFVHQQGVQKNYNAKNMLSSPNYLQILEMDIIFVTFLPP